MVPDRMTFDGRLQHIDIRVWCVLSHAARFRGYCTSTDAQVGARIAASVPTVQRSLLRLTKAGYIDRTPDELGRRRITLRPEGDGAALPGLGVVG